MSLVELIASSFLDLISKQARPECRCKRVLVFLSPTERNAQDTKMIMRVVDGALVSLVFAAGRSRVRAPLNKI